MEGGITGPDLLQAGPRSEKNVGPLIYEYTVTPDCLHPTLSGPTRTVVIIDILLRTRAAMHRATLVETLHFMPVRFKFFCPFVEAPFFFGGGGTCSAEHAEHA